MSLRNRTAFMTVQGRPQAFWLKTAKGQVVLRPRGMKGFVWDYIVDLKLDVLSDMHFKPKGYLPRILTSDVTSKQAVEPPGKRSRCNTSRKSVILWK